MKNKIVEANKLLETIGYRLYRVCGAVDAVRTIFVTYNDLRSWLTIRVKYIRMNNGKFRLYFTSEINRIPCGNSILKVPDAHKIRDIWGEYLDICDKLNDLCIYGDYGELAELVK